MAMKSSDERGMNETQAERDAMDTNRDRDTNPDAITGAPGSHPVGTGIGAVAAGAAGAAIGSVVPGVGTVIGGAIGAVVGAVGGGYAGKAVAEAIDPTAEMDYWRENHTSRPYYDKSYSFDDDYAPAYQYGYSTRNQYQNKTRDQVDAELRRDWDKNRQKSKLSWDQASAAVDDSWDRYDDAVESRPASTRSVPGQQAGQSGTTPNLRP